MDTKYLEIIKSPIITEKTASLKEKNKYVFKTDSKANKTEIKNAIEKLFNVEVLNVQTLNIKPKKRRVGRYPGLSNRCKKAFVTIKDGQTIDLN